MKPFVSVNITTDEVYVKNNGLPNGTYNVEPHYARVIKRPSDTIGSTQIIVEIKNSEDHPFPIDLKVSVTGTFDLTQIAPDERDKFLRIAAVQTVFPYVRGIVSSVTSSSLFPPIIIPIVNVLQLFPD